MIKKILQITILLCVQSVFSQQKNTLIIGAIKDSIGAVKNVNVLNLNTKIGSSSNDDGVFQMKVSLGDSLRISSIQHFAKIIYIDKNTIKTKKIAVKLKIQTTVLDAFELRKHNLSGRLGIDTKNAPTHKKDSLLRAAMNFSQINWDDKVGDDYIDRHVRPQMVNTMAGAMQMAGGAGASVSMPFKHSERLWALRRKLAKKKAFPSKILAEFGKSFFFKKLKIPVQKYYHFLEYCNPLGIENLYENDKKLEVIKILQEQSKSYLKIIKKD